jgi:hypothetical protein
MFGKHSISAYTKNLPQGRWWRKERREESIHHTELLNLFAACFAPPAPLREHLFFFALFETEPLPI